MFACAPLICFYDTCWCLLFLFAAPAVAVSHWGEPGQQTTTTTTRTITANKSNGSQSANVPGVERCRELRRNNNNGQLGNNKF